MWTPQNAITVDKANLGNSGTTGQASATTVSFTTTQAVVSGGFIVLGVSWFSNTITVSSVAGGGLTWTVDNQGSPANPANCNTAIVSAQAPSGLASGTTITATFSATIDVRSICGMSFSGVAVSSPVDGTPPAANGVNPASTSWASSSATLSAGSVLVSYAFCETDSFTNTPVSPTVEGPDFTLGAGWTSQTLCYRIETSAGSYTTAGTWSGSGQTGINAVAYKAAAGGAPAATAPPYARRFPRALLIR